MAIVQLLAYFLYVKDVKYLEPARFTLEDVVIFARSLCFLFTASEMC